MFVSQMSGLMVSQSYPVTKLTTYFHLFILFVVLMAVLVIDLVTPIVEKPETVPTFKVSRLP